jgi:predicted enzyme related to lactoylglutathione lyase
MRLKQPEPRAAPPRGVRSDVEEVRMRTAILTIGLVLASGGRVAWAEKPAPADVGSGRIAWFDITTSSLTQSREFYGKLLGWDFAALEGTDQAVEIVAAGIPIGTLRVAEGRIGAFNGMVYVQVADIVASCGKAVELGGSVAPGFPFNLADRPGAVAVVLDPSGHPIGMYSRAAVPGPPPTR